MYHITNVHLLRLCHPKLSVAMSYVMYSKQMSRVNLGFVISVHLNIVYIDIEQFKLCLHFDTEIQLRKWTKKAYMLLCKMK